MNLVTKEILAILFATSFCILYAQDTTLILTIQTNAENAALFFDDKFIGVGSEIQVETKPGIHLIQVVSNLKEWNAEIITDTINTEDSESLFLNYDFNAQLILNTIPQDVSVFERDSLVGFTPILLEESYNEIKLEKSYYQSIKVTQEEISKGKIPELLYTGHPPEQHFYGSTLFNILLGTAIALGATTAYYKLEADNKFDEYKITGNPELIDDVDKYDLLSGATLIALEVNFALIIYFFLAD